MKKTFTTIGLFTLMLVLTSFTAPQTTTTIVDNNTETVNGAITGIGSRKLDGAITGIGSRKLDGAITGIGSRKLDGAITGIGSRKLD